MAIGKPLNKSTSKTRERERSKSRLKQNRLGDSSTEAPKKKSTSKTRERERSKSRLKQNRLGDSSTEAPKKKSTSKTRERERAKSRESQRGVTRSKEAKEARRREKFLEKFKEKFPDNKVPKTPQPPVTLPKPGKKPSNLDEILKKLKPKELPKARFLNKGGKVTRSNNKGKRYI